MTHGAVHHVNSSKPSGENPILIIIIMVHGVHEWQAGCVVCDEGSGVWCDTE